MFLDNYPLIDSFPLNFSRDFLWGLDSLSWILCLNLPLWDGGSDPKSGGTSPVLTSCTYRPFDNRSCPVVRRLVVSCSPFGGEDDSTMASLLVCGRDRSTLFVVTHRYVTTGDVRSPRPAFVL